jgi:hypothetical protein
MKQIGVTNKHREDAVECLHYKEWKEEWKIPARSYRIVGYYREFTSIALCELGMDHGWQSDLTRSVDGARERDTEAAVNRVIGSADRG